MNLDLKTTTEDINEYYNSTLKPSITRSANRRQTIQGNSELETHLGTTFKSKVDANFL